MNVIIYSVIVAFLIVLLLGPIIIPALKKFKFGQFIREEGPQSHMKKAGTPTMGGIMFIISSIITTLIVYQDITMPLLFTLITMLGYGMVGFIDDTLKIKKKNNEGLKAHQKFLGQVVVALILTVYAYHSKDIGSAVHIPFTNKMWDLGIWYIPFMIFVIVGTVNGVNLTDGLDGLGAGVTVLVSVFFTVVTYSMHKTDMAIFCGALTGSLLGFLKYNSYPAQVFMGDTGSLALGGAISAIAVLLKMPFILVIVGAIYVIEVLSVIIQVVSFKLTKKRVFKMAPLHHHFEQCGWHETKVVSWFCIFTAIFCLVGFLAISY
jgi:phospho-N-acetylmuramoyl-pentapeptide-transferase